MRATLVVAVLCLAGCTKNVAELRAAQADADRRLVELREIADKLNERRREADALERRVELAAEGLPAETVAAVDAGVFEPALTATPIVLPEYSPLEGAEAERLRQRISDTTRRIAELEKVIGEVRHVEARKRQLAGKLKALEALRALAPDAGR